MKKKKIILTAIFIIIGIICSAKISNAASSVKVNFINVDEDGLYVEDWIEQDRIRNGYSDTTYYEVSLVLVKLNDEGGTIAGQPFKINYLNPEIDLVEKYPDFFEPGGKYAILYARQYGNFWLNPVLAGYKATVNGEEVEEITTGPLTNNYAIIYPFTYGDDVNFNMDLYWQMMSGRYNIKIHNVIEEDDPDLEPVKTHYYWFKYYYSHYVKLLKEDDGNRIYVFIPDSIVGTKVSEDEVTQGVVAVDSDKITTIIAPGQYGGEFKYASYDSLVPGYIGATYSSDGSGPGLKASRNFIFSFASKYGIKTFTKTDVDGNKVDAQFEIATKYDNSTPSEAEIRKFKFKHFDEKVIDGTTYKNIYMVVGTAGLDEELDECIVNTEDGEFTLYYPLFRQYLMDSGSANGAYLEQGTIRCVDNIYVYEKDADVGYILNPEMQLDTSNRYVQFNMNIVEQELIGFRANVMNYGNNITDRVTINDNMFLQRTEFDEDAIMAVFDSIQKDGEAVTIVNKRKPIVEGVMKDNKAYDGKFTFKVYDKETGELVATLSGKAGEELALEPRTVIDGGQETGYLIDGRTYIVRESESDDYDLEDVTGNNGDINGDDLSFEFTFDASLSKVCKAVFNNNLIEPEPEPDPEPDPELDPDPEPEPEDPSEESEEPAEEPTEESKEEVKPNEKESPQTGDVTIKIVCMVLILIVSAYGIKYIIKK